MRMVNYLFGCFARNGHTRNFSTLPFFWSVKSHVSAAFKAAGPTKKGKCVRHNYCRPFPRVAKLYYIISHGGGERGAGTTDDRSGIVCALEHRFSGRCIWRPLHSQLRGSSTLSQLPASRCANTVPLGTQRWASFVLSFWVAITQFNHWNKQKVSVRLMTTLRVEFLLKTDSGYPKDKGGRISSAITLLGHLTSFWALPFQGT